MNARSSWLIATMLLAACEGPQAGELTFDLVSPNDEDGAVQVIITAAPSQEVSSITAACSACRVFALSANEGELRGIVTGAITNGAFLRVVVSHVGKPDAYSVRVVQVASRDYELRPSTEGYRVILVP